MTLNELIKAKAYELGTTYSIAELKLKEVLWPEYNTQLRHYHWQKFKSTLELNTHRTRLFCEFFGVNATDFLELINEPAKEYVLEYSLFDPFKSESVDYKAYFENEQDLRLKLAEMRKTNGAMLTVTNAYKIEHKILL